MAFRIVLVENSGKVNEDATRELLSRELTWRANRFSTVDEASLCLRDFRLPLNGGGIWEVRPT